MKPSLRHANVKWFSERQKRKRGRNKSSPQQIVAFRLADFARLFQGRYRSVTLPNDDSGRDDIEPVIHHLASMRQSSRRARLWLELWAPWLTLKEQREIIREGIDSARAWTADQLAWRYHVTKEERMAYGLTTIGAVDQGKAARTKLRKERDRGRKRAKRQAAGATPRKVYEANSIERAKPWVAEGISRRTWYRRRGTGPKPDTGPATP